ncbi:MAG: single-stranded-DNA-specific exonuclease RecJ [Kiritimatiellia bacterium]
MSSWIFAPAPAEELVATVASETGLSPLVATILTQRAGSLEGARNWLDAGVEALCDPFALDGMRATVDRIRQALTNHERISVFGDYDTDGVTGTAVLVQALKMLGANVSPFIPDRTTEGYGLTDAAAERCVQRQKPQLLITVDNAITAVSQVADLRHQGIDVLITDHHTALDTLPAAVAIVNPRISAPSQATEMCGCATAFTVVRALAADGLPIDPLHFLDLVAIATIADVMKLTGDNRILVTQGLHVLTHRSKGNSGLQSLFNELHPSATTLSAERVAFGIVPCINAASRINDVKLAYALLGLERSEMAPRLIAVNHQRRAIERETLETILKENPLDTFTGRALIVGAEQLHSGVVGIVAARLMVQFKVPVAVVVRTADGGGHGSMRSCGSWNAVQALTTVADLLEHYGGHAQAAGFTLKAGSYQAFARRLPDAFSEERTEEPLLIDGDLTEEPITLALCRELNRLEPYGNANPRPIFVKPFRLETIRPCGAEGRHLQLRLCPLDETTSLKAIWFQSAERAKTLCPGMQLRVAFTIEEDTFREPTVALKIVEVQQLDGQSV